jgi:integrase
MKALPAFHLFPAKDLAEAKVSNHSRWDGAEWHFDNPTAGQHRSASTIAWGFDMPDGTSFAGPQWAVLRDAFKRLVWSLFNDPMHGKHYKPAMAVELQRQIVYFVRWMALAGYENLGELDGASFEEYVDYLMADKGAAPSVKATHLMRYLGLPTLISAQGPLLTRAGVSVPSAAPWGGAGAFEKAKDLAEDIRGSIPPIPDAVFLKAMGEAMSELDAAEDVLRMIDERHDLTVGRRRAYGASQELRERSDHLRNACLVVIQGLVGMRVSELCGLKSGWRREMAWPECLEVRPSASGLTELFYIKGQLFKTVQTALDVEWICGARPVGDLVVPPAARAVMVLERLYRSERLRDGVFSLAAFYCAPRGYGGTIKSMDTSTVNRMQGRFFDSIGLSDWDVSSHQWRKTFAQYVIRCDQRLLPTIRDHFKHLSIAMTEQGYLASDPEMKQIMDDTAVQTTVSLVGDLMTGRSEARGPLAAMFAERAANLGARLGNRSEKDRLDDIEDLVRTSGMRVWEVRTGHAALGLCLFRRGTGQCTDGCAARFVLRMPVWSAARPDLCWECKNLLVDPSHAEFWRDRLTVQRAALENAEAAGDEGLAMLCRDRVAQSLNVLERVRLKEDCNVEPVG